MTNLKAPKQDNCLRVSDCFFIDSLKKEMADNLTSLVSPIVSLASLDSSEV